MLASPSPQQRRSMVRFKNRWLLVEFLQPSQLAPSGVLSSPLDGLPTLPVLEEDEQQSEDEEDESYPHASSSKLPFMLPVAGPPRPLLSGDAKTRQKTLSTYIRQSVLETFGDDGHSKCSSLAGAYMPSASFGKKYSLRDVVSYFSPATSLAILRISRDHYRLASAAVNFITQIEGTRVVPRTVYVSGASSR